MDSVLVYFVFGSCALFAVGYTVLARDWWRTRVGLAMGLRDIVIALALLPQVGHFAFGFSLAIGWFAWYWRASMLALGVVTCWRFWVIARLQLRGRGRRGEERDGADA
jgi:hypothetical protein